MTGADSNSRNTFDIETVVSGSRLGWLINMHPTTWTDPETNVQKSALSLYFIQEDGVNFRADLPFHPYFYVAAKEGHTREVENYLRRKYERHVANVQAIQKEDLELKNHLSGLTKTYLKVSFLTVQSLLAVRNELLPFIKKNKERIDIMEAYEDPMDSGRSQAQDGSRSRAAASDYLLDIREYDIPYYSRVAIDLGIRVGLWYRVDVGAGDVKLEHRKDLVGRPEARVLAFDIETTKQPLKFPEPTLDKIMMISYMLDGQGYLIINRSVVSADIENFEYTPKPEYEGKFTVYNEPDEIKTLERFFQHIRKAKPNIIVTFNGDFFDWPFVEARAKVHGMDFPALSGVREDQGEYKGQFVSHLDAFSWVRRDSYLPQGSQGLKAVTKNKLGYDPLELDPEDMTNFAETQPHTLASYSVSDAVATYYLYMIYIHPFIFSLCTIIPMNPHDVLRKGSGTLCESLLMAQAFKANIIFPNKHVTDPLKMYEGHLLESETYVGGHVESLESGVFRDDIDVKFTTSKSAYDGLADYTDRVLEFAVLEGKLNRADITNYDEVKDAIMTKLEKFRVDSVLKEPPAIYHVDVAAMYPNIILTNRLQPSAVVNQEICASCDFNKPENRCQRVMEWEWRGDYVPANSSEYRFVKEQLEAEKFPDPKQQGKMIPFADLPHADQVTKIKTRLKDYSKKVYKKTHTTKNMVRADTVCMRENSFYVDTVRDFRDRRYVYKGEHKTWKNRFDKAQSAADIQECQEMVVLYESLQLAHKCILNSFYGYVMRKGARWYSMETAGIVTYTGAKIIREARETVEKIGRPLELDTDGIWCILPSSFPQNFTFTTTNPKASKFHFSYPIMLLNAKVADKFTNDQYQVRSSSNRKEYEIRDECSILFEMDGPYKAIVLPASREQDVKLKKRYAVFNKNGTIAELKGFEIKRRGELKLVKDFQAQVFDKFLKGSTLEETYASVAAVANHYLDILDSMGSAMEDDELINLITEASNMSRKLDDYEKQRSCAITTAKRLAEFLGQEMIKEKGLACSYIISKKPAGTMVTDRAIPVAIFSIEPIKQRYFLAQWLKTNASTSLALRDIIDWDYYRSRLASTVQKIITIPAALQKVPNPVPRVPHPDWLSKNIRMVEGQRAITDIFQRRTDKPDEAAVVDMEDVAGATQRVNRPVVHSRKRGRREIEPELPPLPDGELPEYRSIDYDDWLKHQKAIWKYKRAMRKRGYLDPSGLSEQNKRLNDGTFASHLTSRATPIVKSEWHVIQLRPTSDPGKFVMWALAGDSIINLYLTVPRTFYINSRIPDQSGVGKKVSMIPPRSKSHQYTYQYTMSEATYQDNAKELSMQFTHPSIEGVYERSVPLLWRSFLEMGSVCRLGTAASRVPLSKVYSIDDIMPSGGTGGFHHSTSTSRPVMSYLNHKDLQRIYLYHSGSEGRGALFAVAHPNQNKGHIILVNFHSAQEKKQDLMRQLTNKHPTIEFELTRVQSLAAGHKVVQELLAELTPKQSGQLNILLLQSNKPPTLLAKNIPAIDEFPRISIAANAADNEYLPLSWEAQATKIFAHRLDDVGAWWDHTLQLARYANLPVGNLEGDLTLLVSDVFFARQLREAHHLLWVSSSNLPDLGGSEEDDAMFAEELINPELSEPGFYRPFCVELDMANLAINTVLEAAHISDIEGGSGLLAFEGDAATSNGKGDAPKSYDQSTICTNEFKILRKLITRWSVDTSSDTQAVSGVADGLLSQFYRWISTPHALLYDPAIHKLIHDLTRKVFMQLMLEFRRFGAKIIFANYNKVIISTNKETLADAEAYSAYILSAIKKKDLFAWIDIRPLRFWENLLWMDRANYGGVEDMKNEKIVSHWNISEYLPKAIQEYFLIIITDYILQTHKADEMQRANGGTPLAASTSSTSDSGSQPMQTDAFDEQGEGRSSPIITNLTQRLFVIVQNIQHTLTGDHSQGPDQPSSEFPKLAGSHLPMNNPALEFIKFVCHVLAMDRPHAQDVNRLKKNLLRLINVREFATEAAFANPCLSYVLPDVMCEFCNFGRDLDLLRDAPVLPTTASSAPTFGCTSCGHPYNRHRMEATLVDIVQKRDLAYQLQDLVCSKCRAVKASNMGDMCTNCSGQWVCKESLPAFKKSMMVFRNIAEFYKFDWLLEVVNTCTSV